MNGSTLPRRKTHPAFFCFSESYYSNKLNSEVMPLPTHLTSEVNARALVDIKNYMIMTLNEIRRCPRLPVAHLVILKGNLDISISIYIKLLSALKVDINQDKSTNSNI